MVSIVVISILASLSLAGLAVARTSAKKAKTAATIRKISEIILPYYEEYETRRPGIPRQAEIANIVPNGRSELSRAKQLAIRRLMTLEMPERSSDFRDAFSRRLDGSLAVRDRTETFAGLPVTFSDAPPCARRYYALTLQPDGSFKNVRSSELLHLIVTRGPVADPDVIAHFRDDEVLDTDKNGLPEFVDGWNRPIQFRRWPIGFQSPMQPIDGTRRTIEPMISNDGHRLVPLIFSAGPDKAYDIAANLAGGADVAYFANKYDPFMKAPSSSTSLRLAIPPAAPLLAGSVLLTGTMLSENGPLVLQATRATKSTSPRADAFQTIGSECDVDSPSDSPLDGPPNGVVESIDNIHNHDMTR